MHRYFIPVASAFTVTVARRSTNRQQLNCNASQNSHHAAVTVDKVSDITVLYADKANFDKKMHRFIKGGAKKLQVLTDFDFTLSRFRIGDKRASSCHRLIEGSGFLPAHIVHQADSLFNYYYQKEVATSITMEEKIHYMEEWASKAAELFVS